MPVPQTPAPQPVATGARSAPTASQTYRALTDQREVLGSQLREVQDVRNNLVEEMRHDGQTAATKASLEKRIANADARITDLDQQIAVADKAVANAAAVPGATYRPPVPPREGMDPDAVAALTALFMFIVFLPISIAFARRIWRRSAKATVVLPPEVSQRMESLERGMEAIALEVERIGEGQRFVTQALVGRGEIRAVGAGAAEPVVARPGEKIGERL